jgi:hypothetical protein
MPAMTTTMRTDDQIFSPLTPPAATLAQKKPSASRARETGQTKLVDPGASPGLIERSIFHEPWWLDAATDGHWDLAFVKNGNQEVIAEMPYALTRKCVWSLCLMPNLTRTLGPVIKPQPKGATQPEWGHRLELARELSAQLPACARFHQTMDTRVSEAEVMGFSLEGFHVSVSYTIKFRVDGEESELWAGLRRNTRNWIRRASEQLTVCEITSADQFADFYDANLAARKRHNVYNSATMRRLLREVVRRKAGKLLGAFTQDARLSAAIVLIWDSSALYYILSTRKTDAHGGAVSLLLWRAMCEARERKLILDFDGISHAGILEFLAGFGGQLARRFEIERIRPDYAALRSVLHRARAALKDRSPNER